jgi:hypothetical protein
MRYFFANLTFDLNHICGVNPVRAFVTSVASLPTILAPVVFQNTSDGSVFHQLIFLMVRLRVEYGSEGDLTSLYIFSSITLDENMEFFIIVLLYSIVCSSVRVSSPSPDSHLTPSL